MSASLLLGSTASAVSMSGVNDSQAVPISAMLALRVSMV